MFYNLPQQICVSKQHIVSLSLVRAAEGKIREDVYAASTDSRGVHVFSRKETKETRPFRALRARDFLTRRRRVCCISPRISVSISSSLSLPPSLSFPLYFAPLPRRILIAISYDRLPSNRSHLNLCHYIPRARLGHRETVKLGAHSRR